MDYELIVTLGPTSQTEQIWEDLIAEGATSFRLNTSHMTLEQLRLRLNQLERFFFAKQIKLPVVLDLQGSKWRLGEFTEFTLEPGMKIQLINCNSTEELMVLPVPHFDFFKSAAESGRELVLNDAKNRLKILDCNPSCIHAEVIQGGPISSRKGITFNHTQFRMEELNPKDASIIELSSRYTFVQYAISYVKDAAEMLHYRYILGSSSFLIAKLERQSALDQVSEIARAVDQIWICRGDLGAELGMRGMAREVSRISSSLKTLLAPTIMAGQVLEHMTHHATPTRSEVCHLHDILQLGYQGIVLSDETAIGEYPVQACRVAAMFQPGNNH